MASLFHKFAIHPNLFSTGVLPKDFLDAVLRKIKEKEYQLPEDGKFQKYEEALEKIVDKTLRLIRVIEPNADLDSLQYSFDFSSEEDHPDEKIFFFLHDCIHEILYPKTVQSFHQLEKSEQTKPGIYSIKQLQEEDIASALTSNSIINVGLGRLIVEEFVQAAKQFGSFFQEKDQRKENRQYIACPYSRDNFLEIVKIMKSSLVEKLKKESNLAKNIVTKVLNFAEDELNKMEPTNYISYEDLIDPQVKFLLKKNITSIVSPFPKKEDELITDHQAKKIRMFLNNVSRIVDQSFS